MVVLGDVVGVVAVAAAVVVDEASRALAFSARHRLAYRRSMSGTSFAARR